MDVRCEKCQTEYELDESKLKPGGVTVKCTTCGHMFKVRGRQAPSEHLSTVGPPVVHDRTPTPGPASASQSASMSSSMSEPPRASSVLMDAEEGERTWLIRLEDGEIKTCRELSTLQKWIVSGRVSRSCSISRTGKKWKLLGEIGELASFFGIADEAREARVSGRWSASTREYPADAGDDDSFAGDPPLHLDGDRRDGDGHAQGGRDGSGDVPLSSASYGGMVQEPHSAASSSTPGSFVRTLPLGGAGLSPGARTTGAQRDAHHAAGQMTAQAAPSGHDLPIEPIERDEPADDDPGDDDHDGHERSAAEPSALGNAPTLPPYGAGMLDGTGSGATPRPSTAGLPLTPPPSRPAPAGAPVGPVTGGWATGAQAERALRGGRDAGPSGPVSGMARGGVRSSDEAVFVGGGGRHESRHENARYMAYSDDEPLIAPRNRTGLWVFLFSLVVMAAAAGVVYLLLYTGDEEDVEAPAQVATEPGAGVAPSPGPAAPAPLPTTPTPPPAPAQPGPAAEMDKLVHDADAALLADSQEALEPLSQQLSALASGAGGEGAASPTTLIARARIENALAQQLADQARLAATPADTKKLTDQSRARAKTGHQLAEQALSHQADSAAALVAMADARRLEGERTIEVERMLRRVAQNPADAVVSRDADLALALLRIRDKRLRDARILLEKLVKGAPAEDVRGRFRLAWLDYLDDSAGAAVSGAEAVLKVQTHHAGARALLDKLGGAGKPPVDTRDAMPPEDQGAGGKPEGGKPEAGKPKEPVAGGKPVPGGGKPAGGGSDSFDTVLERAEKLAENGNCGGAMPLYRKVLDMNPASVEALTGLGNCHLDRKEFASAHARFRAALGISSRYQPAMWGIAEAYQRQGLKEQALERFEAFVEAHPSGTRADAARERIELLKREIGEGGGSKPESKPEGGDQGATPPDTSGGGGGTGGSGSSGTSGGGTSGGGSSDSPDSSGTSGGTGGSGSSGTSGSGGTSGGSSGTGGSGDSGGTSSSAGSGDTSGTSGAGAPQGGQ